MAQMNNALPALNAEEDKHNVFNDGKERTITPLISPKASTFRRPFRTAHREAGMQCSNNLCKCAWNTRPTPLSDPIRMHSSKMCGYECMRTVCDAPG